MKEYIDLVARVVGLLAAIISLVVAIIAYQNANQARESSTNNEASIKSLSGKLSKTEAGIIVLEDETQSLRNRIAKTEEGLSVAPQSEPVVLAELIVPDVSGIIYADYAHQLQQVRDGFLRNNFSGYPDLLISVRRLLDGRCPIGNPVPLPILNEKYLGNTSQPVMTHDMARIKNAYVAAWRDKNMGSAIQDFESMAPHCPNKGKTQGP